MRRIRAVLSLFVRRSQTRVHTESISPELARAYVCPLTLSLFVDPVIDREGHTYERAAIMRWLESNNTSPLTRNKLLPSHLVPNRNLRAACQSLNALLSRESESERLSQQLRGLQEKMAETIGALEGADTWRITEGK